MATKAPNSAWEALISSHGFGSTEEVANRAEMSSGHLSHIARGLREPRLSTALHLARVIGCTVEALARAIGTPGVQPLEDRQVG